MKIGDKVICNLSGIYGTVVQIYTPTACERQLMVKTNDGRLYHAPYSTWTKVREMDD